MNKEQKNQINHNHRPSIAGLWQIYKKRKLYWKWPFLSAAISTIIVAALLSFIIPEKSLDAIKGYIDLILLVFPCLLGFSLAGYVIVVGFPNTELLEVDADVNDYSMYQILSAFFAIAIICQIVTTTIAFIISGIIKTNINEIFILNCNLLSNAINIFFLSVMVFISLYSVLLTPYIVINLFSLSQTNSSYITIKKFNKSQ